MSANAPNITIRPARIEERRPLEELQRRASLANEADRAALLAHPDAIELPDDHIQSGSTLVAERDSAVCGFAVVLPRDDGEAELDGLFVEPDIWKGGIGRALVEAAAQVAQTRGASWIYVVGNEAALGFYHRCGFVECGAAQTRFAPAKVLRRALEA